MTRLHRFNSLFGALMIALAVSGEAVRAEPIVYVPLGSDGEILAVDGAQDKIVGSMSGIEAVHGLAGTPDGRFLIAGSYVERSADGAAPAKPEGLTEDDHAAHHKPPADDDGASSSDMVSTVSVICTADQTIVRAIDVPGAVHHVAVDPAGRFASVTHPNEGRISIIDLSTYEVAATVATGSLPNYAAFSPDGKRLYVSNAGDDAVTLLTTADWTVNTVVKVGSSPEHLVLSPDGAMLYVNNVDDGSVSIIDTANRRVLSTIRIGSTLHGIDLSVDGRMLLVAVLGDDNVAQINLATKAVKFQNLSPEPYHLTTITGTGKIYVSSADEPKIWVLDEKDLAVIGQIDIHGKGHQMVPMPGS